MIDLQLEPHDGIGPIKLGASRIAVRETLRTIGFPVAYTHGRLDYFCDNAIQVEFGDDVLAEFIGIAFHPAYRLTFRGINVFDVEATALFALIASVDDSGPHEFDRYGYTFPNQIVTLWEADEQYDHLGEGTRPVWGQVGLGNERYLQAVPQINSE